MPSLARRRTSVRLLTPAERRASIKREKRLVRRKLAYTLPSMPGLVMPHYDPAKPKVLACIAKALEFYKQRDPIRVSFADVADTIAQAA